MQNIKTNHELFNKKFVVLGDFNICRRAGVTNVASQFDNCYHLLDDDDKTTISKQQIGWALTDITKECISAITYETVHSYIDAICISIKYPID